MHCTQHYSPIHKLTSGSESTITPSKSSSITSDGPAFISEEVCLAVLNGLTLGWLEPPCLTAPDLWPALMDWLLGQPLASRQQAIAAGVTTRSTDQHQGLKTMISQCTGVCNACLAARHSSLCSKPAQAGLRNRFGIAKHPATPKISAESVRRIAQAPRGGSPQERQLSLHS